jgi:hypothetical protein
MATKGNAGRYGAVGQGLRELAVRFKVGWFVSKTHVSFGVWTRPSTAIAQRLSWVTKRRSTFSIAAVRSNICHAWLNDCFNRHLPCDLTLGNGLLICDNGHWPKAWPQRSELRCLGTPGRTVGSVFGNRCAEFVTHLCWHDEAA